MALWRPSLVRISERGAGAGPEPVTTALAPIRDPSLVVPTIAQVLGIRESGAQPLSEQVREALRIRHLLLVLDNIEQVAAVSPELEELLSGCPQLKLLVTSRSLLHLGAE